MSKISVANYRFPIELTLMKLKLWLTSASLFLALTKKTERFFCLTWQGANILLKDDGNVKLGKGKSIWRQLWSIVVNCFSRFWCCSKFNGDDVQTKIVHWNTVLVKSIGFIWLMMNVCSRLRMAPEVAAVEKNGGYNQLCDIWAVGITAIEFAELQPPMFDIHPMRALFLMSKSGFKSPTLTEKRKWSSTFHNFVKYALTKNPKSRPAASRLLDVRWFYVFIRIFSEIFLFSIRSFREI